MSKYCPVLNQPVTYMACLDCDEKECRNEKSNVYRRGDIVFVKGDESTVIGHEQRPNRPAIIVSNNKNNTFGSVLEVVYLTTALKKPLPTHVEINSLKRPSTALCEAVYSVSTDRISDFMGRCTPEELESVDAALKVSLNLVEV